MTKFAIFLLDYSLTENRIIRISGVGRRTEQKSGEREGRIKRREAWRKPWKFVIQNDPAYKVHREVRVVR